MFFFVSILKLFVCIKFKAQHDSENPTYRLLKLTHRLDKEFFFWRKKFFSLGVDYVCKDKQTRFRKKINGVEVKN